MRDQARAEPGKLELRVRGPNITPGYWRLPDATRSAFDDEGYYKMGDAVRFVDPEDPQRGFMFDGRVSEDFKLVTGTWVSVGNLRAAMIAAFAPFVRDVVVAGHDRDDVSAILLLDPDGCVARFPELRSDLSPAALSRHGDCASLQELLVSSEPPRPALDARRADGHPGRAALDRSRRGNGQRFDQPARGARPSHWSCAELYGEKPRPGHSPLIPEAN